MRTVFYAQDSSIAETMRRSAIAAYMAGEAQRSEVTFGHHDPALAAGRPQGGEAAPIS